MDLPNTITSISIGVTFIISVLGLYISSKNSRKITFINSITSSRIKWIGDLRLDISRFCGLVTHYRISDEMDDTDLRKVFEDIDVLGYKIQLALNRTDPIDTLIIKKINSVLENIESEDDIPESEIESLLELTQDLLKFEWERVKRESQIGNLSTKQKNSLTKKFWKGKYETSN